MTEQATPGTVHLHRILRAPRARVYRAFTEPDALLRWLPPYGFLARLHDFTPGVGGGYRMSFINFGTGSAHSFTVKFVELVENRRIRHTDTFDSPGPPGEMDVTVELKDSVAGTELRIVQAGIPAAIPVDLCHLGWRESLDMLEKLVEPEIPDQG